MKVFSKGLKRYLSLYKHEKILKSRRFQEKFLKYFYQIKKRLTIADKSKLIATKFLVKTTLFSF